MLTVVDTYSKVCPTIGIGICYRGSDVVQAYLPFDLEQKEEILRMLDYPGPYIRAVTRAKLREYRTEEFKELLEKGGISDRARHQILRIVEGRNPKKPITVKDSSIRHRHHYLSAVQRPLDAHCGDRRSRSDHQDFEPPGLAYPCPTTNPGPARRVPTNGLISPGNPVQCRSRHSPFAQFPHAHITMVRHAGLILGKWAGQILLTGCTPAFQTAESAD